MRAQFPFVLVLVSGCFQVTESWTCREVSRAVVGEDEQTPAGSPDELLSLVGIVDVFPGVYDLDGTEANVDVAVAQDGDAVWVEQRKERERERDVGFGRVTSMHEVVCPNQLELPLVAQLQTTDGALDMLVDGAAVLDDPDGESFRSPGVPMVHLEGDHDHATFPPLGWDDAAWEGQRHTFVNLEFDEVGFREGSAGWGASSGSTAVVDYVVRFGPGFDGAQNGDETAP